MSPGIDRELLAELSGSVERHLRRVAEHLPEDAADLQLMSAETDVVVLHLWQAVQIVIDLAVSSCVRLGLGSPPSYGDAFRQLAAAGVIDSDLVERLARAAGFRNLIVHAYADLELHRVHAVPSGGPADLRALLAALRDHTRAECWPLARPVLPQTGAGAPDQSDRRAAEQCRLV
jgi:uncharacterized protein YutE (UPF0331/DUF86 family)